MTTTMMGLMLLVVVDDDDDNDDDYGDGGGGLTRNMALSCMPSSSPVSPPIKPHQKQFFTLSNSEPHFTIIPHVIHIIIGPAPW